MARPNITEIKPVGSCVLIQRLSDNDLKESQIFIPENSTPQHLPQGVILKIGPGVQKENYGFEEGDRVLLVGTSNPTPPLNEDDEVVRELVEPHTIRAVLVEADE